MTVFTQTRPLPFLDHKPRRANPSDPLRCDTTRYTLILRDGARCRRSLTKT